MIGTPARPVRFALSPGGAGVTLDRPSVLNSIDVGMARALAAAITHAEATAGVRALLLQGAGRAFCAGGDVSHFDGGEPYSEVADRMMSHFHPALLTLATSRLPTVAAVHGAVAGAGMALMLACDFALAATDTRFTLAYPKIGATIDGGASWFLPRLVGTRKAKELALLSGQIDAATAADLGLVTRITDADALDEEASALARQLAVGPSAAYAAIKGLIDTSYARDLGGQLDAERNAFVDIAATADFAEGLGAFLAKRTPSFKGK